MCTFFLWVCFYLSRVFLTSHCCTYTHFKARQRTHFPCPGFPCKLISSVQTYSFFDNVDNSQRGLTRSSLFVNDSCSFLTFILYTNWRFLWTWFLHSAGGVGFFLLMTQSVLAWQKEFWFSISWLTKPILGICYTYLNALFDSKYSRDISKC